MSQAPHLLNDDGTASLATLLLLSHHAFRRDIARFIRAIAHIKSGDVSRADAVRNEWETSYRQALHGHHTMEDTQIFPAIKNRQHDLAPALERLTGQHHQIDPILKKIDAAISDITHPENLEDAFADLKALLDEHLNFEEAQITPALRDQKEFPAPATEEMAAVYAQGFAWSMQGIAPEVLDQVKKLLPDILLAKLPESQREFERRSERVWGAYARGAAVTSIPEGY